MEKPKLTMDENHLKMIYALKLLALDDSYYRLAYILKDAEEELKSKLRHQWTINITEGVAQAVRIESN